MRLTILAHTIMSLGSRWQALLFLLLRIYFHITECQNFEKGDFNSLEYVIYLQHILLTISFIHCV